MRLCTDLPYWQLSFRSLDLTILVLKYVQNFTKIYKTLSRCTDAPMRPLHALHSLLSPHPTPPPQEKILYETELLDPPCVSIMLPWWQLPWWWIPWWWLEDSHSTMIEHHQYFNTVPIRSVDTIATLWAWEQGFQTTAAITECVWVQLVLGQVIWSFPSDVIAGRH